jgi:hypothetical protein
MGTTADFSDEERAAFRYGRAQSEKLFRALADGVRGQEAENGTDQALANTALLITQMLPPNRVGTLLLGAVSVMLRQPATGKVQAALAAWENALHGDSGDSETEAADEMADLLRRLLPGTESEEG